ncbi:hypothetical protein IWW40_001332 [Coemansia sp. RSA 1250]|nr:hypothetical protein IWW40_001332 [Coemansia sp. RSA 1250]
MRRAHIHMSWSDSMASSVTLAGSRQINSRSRGPSHLARSAQRANTLDPNLRRLVQELNASRIDEEEEEDSVQNRPDYPSNNQTESNTAEQRAAASDTSTKLSRRKRAIHTVKSKLSTLLHLITHYLRRAIEQYGAMTMYRPLQYGMY